MEAKEILDTMLGYLGFVAEIQEVETENGRQLRTRQTEIPNNYKDKISTQYRVSE